MQSSSTGIMVAPKATFAEARPRVSNAANSGAFASIQG